MVGCLQKQTEYLKDHHGVKVAVDRKNRYRICSISIKLEEQPRLRNMKALVETVTHLLPFLSWETCILNLITKNRPSSVSFICQTPNYCPSNDLFKMIRIPVQTLLGLGSDELPMFIDSDLVVLPIHGDDLEWKNGTVEKYLMGGMNLFKVVIVASMRNNSDDDIAFMSTLFDSMWISGITNAAVILKNESVSLMFTYIPFRKADSCNDTSPVLIGHCDQVVDFVFDDTNKVINLNSCPLTVSIADDKPWFQSSPFIGRLKPLLEELQDKMNFTLDIIWPSTGVNGGICGPKERMGTRGDVFYGRAHFAVGAFSKRDCSTLEYINVPYTTCLSWCTPLISKNEYIFTFLISIFDMKVWVALFVAVFVVVVSVVGMCHWTGDRLMTFDLVYLGLLVFAPVPLDYRSTPVRLVLGLWLCACLVMRTAYEGELKSRSAVPLATYIIKDLDGIIERIQRKEFKKLCTTSGNLQVLSTIKNPQVQYLSERSGICSEGMYENIVKAALQKDRAVFTAEQRCRITAADVSNKGPSLVWPLTGGCTKLVQLAPLLTLPGSPFRKRFSRLQHRTFDAGLFLKWTETPSKKPASDEDRALSLRNVLPALFLLFLGFAFGFAILITEIALQLVPRFLKALRSILN